MVMLGMMIGSYDEERIPFLTWMIWAFSPILLPIFIGMMLTEKSKDDE
jgi:hypothetical protein